MDNARADRRGGIIGGRNFWRINNALVEEVSSDDRQTGYIIVSYSAEQQNITHTEQLRLNINRNTVIQNRSGMPVRLNSIRPGTRIDAAFSPAMTRSIPPQTNAYRIIVNQPFNIPKPEPHPDERPTIINRIVRVDARNNQIVTGNPVNANRQMIFNVTNRTQILNSRGRRIPLRALRFGQLVEVTYSNVQTPSIPPQSTAFRIQVI